jgi:hypothetical protein
MYNIFTITPVVYTDSTFVVTYYRCRGVVQFTCVDSAFNGGLSGVMVKDAACILVICAMAMLKISMQDSCPFNAHFSCRALGCLVPSCKLCKHNPSRRCAVNFDKKYLVNDILKAKCQAVIRVEVVERASNQPIESSELRDEMILQMAILDGNTYDAKFEAGMEGDFESCLLLMNNKV